MIMRLLKTASPEIVRPRVTPDPDHAAELQRRMKALAYYPENGFLRDHTAPRRPPRLRLTS